MMYRRLTTGCSGGPRSGPSGYPVVRRPLRRYESAASHTRLRTPFVSAGLVSFSINSHGIIGPSASTMAPYVRTRQVENSGLEDQQMGVQVEAQQEEVMSPVFSSGI
ncbi:MAG: hypothetical protein QW358_00590 [Candidatus Hadarchaeum sp.]